MAAPADPATTEHGRQATRSVEGRVGTDRHACRTGCGAGPRRRLEELPHRVITATYGGKGSELVAGSSVAGLATIVGGFLSTLARSEFRAALTAYR